MNPEERNESWGIVSCWLREWRREYEEENRGDGCVRATIGVILDIDGAIMRAMMSMLCFPRLLVIFVNQKKNQWKKRSNINVAAKILKTNLCLCLSLTDFEPSLLPIQNKTTYPCAVNIGPPQTENCCQNPL